MNSGTFESLARKDIQVIEPDRADAYQQLVLCRARHRNILQRKHLGPAMLADDCRAHPSVLPIAGPPDQRAAIRHEWCATRGAECRDAFVDAQRLVGRWPE